MGVDTDICMRVTKWNSKYVLNALKQIDEIGFAAGYEMHQVHRMVSVERGGNCICAFSIRIRRYKMAFALRAQNYDKTFKCVGIEHMWNHCLVFDGEYFVKSFHRSELPEEFEINV